MADKINKHLVGENESHARLLMTCIDRLESEMASMKRDTVELRSEIAEMRLAREIDGARARETNELVDQIKQEVANLRNENQLAKEENKFLKARIEIFRKQFQQFVDDTERQLLDMRTSGRKQAREMEQLTEKYEFSEMKSSRLEEYRRREKEKLLKNIGEVRDKQACAELLNFGEIVWPIDGWAAKKKSARDGSCYRIYSDPFYSHKNGYKMCLSVWPDGNGIGKGTHLSVYLCLMRGPFDNILSWPFKRAVTLSVIDQATGTDHVSDTLGLPDHDCWKKPSTERNIGLGPSKLIALTELSSNAGLCKDDKIFIRCVVK